MPTRAIVACLGDASELYLGFGDDQALSVPHPGSEAGQPLTEQRLLAAMVPAEGGKALSLCADSTLLGQQQSRIAGGTRPLPVAPVYAAPRAGVFIPDMKLPGHRRMYGRLGAAFVDWCTSASAPTQVHGVNLVVAVRTTFVNAEGKYEAATLLGERRSGQFERCDFTAAPPIDRAECSRTKKGTMWEPFDATVLHVARRPNYPQARRLPWMGAPPTGSLAHFTLENSVRVVFERFPTVHTVACQRVKADLLLGDNWLAQRAMEGRKEVKWEDEVVDDEDEGAGAPPQQERTVSWYAIRTATRPMFRGAGRGDGAADGAPTVPDIVWEEFQDLLDEECKADFDDAIELLPEADSAGDDDVSDASTDATGAVLTAPCLSSCWC